MISVLVLSVIAFLVILGDLNWKWTPQTSAITYTHSIFGIVSIGCALIQVVSSNLIVKMTIYKIIYLNLDIGCTF